MLKDYLSYILGVAFAIVIGIHMFNAYQQFNAIYKYRDERNYPEELVPKLRKYRAMSIWAFVAFFGFSVLLFLIASTQS